MASRHAQLQLTGHGQRLVLVPALGGSVAAWQWLDGGAPIDLWRPWSGTTDDPGTMASTAMLPWCNRITDGGFEQDGQVYPIEPNLPGTPYPIHGDGWHQPWSVEFATEHSAVLALQSRQFRGNPHAYDATHRFALFEGGLEQVLTVTHRGPVPLPYGLGLHPWFLRSPDARLQAAVEGVWLCGPDVIPIAHTTDIPPELDIRAPLSMTGGGIDHLCIDHLYTGWSGQACVHWPAHGLSVLLDAAPITSAQGTRPVGYCQVYRPEQGPAFCMEPVSHAVDAFHLPGRPGLVTLAEGDSLSLSVRWHIQLA